jgi:Right handed beta helix region/Periplasmic copper-binding protein (NosD)
MYRLIHVEQESGPVTERSYDSLGNRLTKTMLPTTADNTSPNEPAYSSPTENITGAPTNGVELSWTGSDPDPDDNITYQVYFGESSTPKLLTSGLSITKLITPRLKSLTTYYWKVISKDSHNATTEGPVWAFTTGNTPPNTPVIISPLDNDSIAYSSAYLNWSTIEDPDEGDTLLYDVYFGTITTPPLVKENTTTIIHNLGTLDSQTTYYWKIVTKDNHGASTEGPVWTFKTVAHEIEPQGAVTYSTDTTITKNGGPYVVIGTITVNTGVTLTIEPGTVIKFGPNAGMNVNGTLIAQGTSENIIIFTSYKDDKYGGDTNLDSRVTHPAPGDWTGLTFRKGSDGSILKHCNIEYAGSNGAVYIYQASPTISNSTIRYSSDYGIYSQGGSPNLSGNTLTNNGKYAIYVAGGSAAITGNDFSQNSSYDIYYNGTTEGNISNNSTINGIYVSSTTALENYSNNGISYNNNFPMRVHPDDVGELMASSSFTGIDSDSYIEVIAGIVTKDATWPDTIRYHITGTITVLGTDGEDAITTLTIAPGAELRFNKSVGLTVGSSSVTYGPGALIAKGTEKKKILFTSNQNNPAPLDWYGITFQNTSDDTTSALDNCIIEYAGSNGAVYIYQAAPTITNSTIRYSSDYGIYSRGGSPNISGNSVTNNGNYAIYVAGGSAAITGNTFNQNSSYDIYYGGTADGNISNNNAVNGIYISGTTALENYNNNTITYNNDFPMRVHPDDVGELMASSTFTGLDSDSYIEVTAGTITKDAIWPDTIRYHITGTITVLGTDGEDAVTTLTIAPGAELRFNKNIGLTVGSSRTTYGPGALIAKGTEEKKILFTSSLNNPAPLDWYGITFQNTSDDTTSVLDHCIIEDAGSNGAVYIYQASPTITNSTIRYSSDYGIYSRGGSPNISGNSVTNNGNYAIYVNTGSAAITGNTFNQNSSYDIYYSGTADGNISNNSTVNGIFVSSATSLENYSNNSISYNNNFPMRVHPDDVGKLMASSTFTGLDSDSYIEVIAGTITKDATWPDTIRYHITGTITVLGTDGEDAMTTLTIAPGAELRFNKNIGLTVGSSRTTYGPGALIAKGTEEKKILFTSNQNNPAPLDWYGITFQNTSDDATSALDHCVIEYAGSNGAVYVYYASPTITNSTIRYSSDYGIYSQGGSPNISGNSVTNNGNYAIYVNTGSAAITGNAFSQNSSYDIYYNGTADGNISNNSTGNGIFVSSATSLENYNNNTITYNNDFPMRVHPDDVGELMASSTFTGLDSDSYIEVTAGTITKDATWPDTIRYHITGTITVLGADGEDAITTLTIAPGAELRFNKNIGLTVGSSSVTYGPGALIAKGTEEKKILFTSNQNNPAPLDWYGITFQNTSDDATSALDHCVIEYAGSNGAVYIYQASPTISNSTIRYSSDYGIYSQGGSPKLSGNTLINNGKYAIYVAGGSAAITGNTFSQNSSYDIYYNGTADGNISNNSTVNGIYISSATALENYSNNSISYHNNFPMRVHPDDVGELIASSTFTGLDSESYIEVTAGTITKDATWPDTIRYHITGSITVLGTDGEDAITTLTIAPGAELRFNKNIGITVGSSRTTYGPGALIAKGTEEKNILFTSNQNNPAPLDWYGITFQNTSDDATSALDHCVIEYAGSNGAVSVYYASPTISNSTIRFSSDYGIYSQGGSPNLSGNTLINNGKYAIYVAGGSAAITGNTFSQNSSYDIYYNGTADGNISNNSTVNGIYISSATALENFSNNSISYHNNFPMRVHPDDVGELMASSTFTGIDSDSYIEVIAGTITKDATWPDTIRYHIAGSITVLGTDGEDAITTLSIAQGAELRFNKSVGLTVGSSSVTYGPGALVAKGTEENPILFTSNQNNPAPLDWYGITFQNTSDDTTSVLDHCIIEYAGSNGAVYIYQASPTITNSTIRYSSDYGIYSRGGSPNISGNSVTNNGNYAIYVNTGSAAITGNTFNQNSSYDIYYSGTADGNISNNNAVNGIYISGTTALENYSNNTITYNNDFPMRVHPDDVGELMASSTFTGLDSESYIEVTAGTITKDATWPDTIRYHIAGSITILGTDGEDAMTTLTIAPGAELRFNKNIGLTVGSSRVTYGPGALIAKGTEEKQILFTSNQNNPAPLDWYGITFQNTSDDATSALDHCIIEYAGSNGVVYVYYASPTISNSTIRYSSDYGIYSQGGSPNLSGNTLTNNGKYAIYIAGGSAAITGNAFSQNSSYDIYYNGTAEGNISNNSTVNGIYISGTTALENYCNNTITYNNDFPMRVHPDDVGELMASSAFTGIDSDSYIEVIAGTITKDATWPDTIRYHITGTITVLGTDGEDAITTLTIAPGAELRFNKNIGLTVGSSSVTYGPGALIAKGTEEKKILFTSNQNNPAPLDWYGITFQNTSDDTTSVLDHCIIEYAGSNGAVYIYQASPTISNSTIRFSSDYGIYSRGGAPTISANSITNNGKNAIYVNTGSAAIIGNTFSQNSSYDIYYNGTADGNISNNISTGGIYVPENLVLANYSNNIINEETNTGNFFMRVHPDEIGALAANNAFSDLDSDSYIEVTAGTITKDATWPDTIRYHITGTITVLGTDGEDAITTLTIAPGAELRFNKNVGLTVGGISATYGPGALIAKGTEEKQIFFTSNQNNPAPLDWYGITFQNTIDDATSALDHCVIEYAGSNGAVYIYQASPTISNSTIRFSSDYGIYSRGGAPTISANSITNNGKYAIYVNTGSATITGITFSQNSSYDIYYNGTADGNISNNSTVNGIYVSTTTAIESYSNNSISYNNNFPIRVHPDDVGELMASSTFTGIDSDSYIEVIAGTITKDATWPDTIRYHITGTITVLGTDGEDAITTLTIAPGAELRFNKNIGLTVGSNRSTYGPGALIAKGTEEKNILFTSNQNNPAPLDWYGITFQNTSDDATSALNHCVIEFAGSNGAVYVYYASPTISNSTIRYSSDYGINSRGGAPTISANSITNNANYAIYVAGGSAAITGNAFSQNSSYDIYYTGTADGNISNNSTVNGIYVSSTTALENYSNNTITYNNNFPMRVHPDDVGELMASSTFTGIDSDSYIEVIAGTITKDATWPDTIRYHVTGTITVLGTDGEDAITTLSIAPGAELRFNKSVGLTVGSSSVTYGPGALIAKGTEEKKILFTSNQKNPAPFDWYGITFLNTSDDTTSVLDHCIIEYAGSNGAVYIYQASPTITNSTIRYSSDYGIYSRGGSPNISGNSVTNNGNYAIYVNTGSAAITGNAFSQNSSYDIYYNGTADGNISNNSTVNGIFVSSATSLENYSNNTITYNNDFPMRVHPDDVGELMASSSFTGIDSDSYIEVIAGTITKDATWPDTIRYHITGAITVLGADGEDAITTLTIAPGAELRFNKNVGLTVGSSRTTYDPGALIAKGTEEKKILFTSNQNNPALLDWYGITFQNTSDDTTSVLDHCIIEYAGSNGAVYIYQASPTITNSTIRYSSDYGIYSRGGSPNISGNSVTNNGNYAIYVNTGSAAITGNAFSQNSSYDIYYNGTADGNISNNSTVNGIYVSSTTALENYNNNTITYNNDFPMRVHPDDVGELMASSSFTGIDSDSYIEVIAGTITKDATWPDTIRYHVTGTITVLGTDGEDAITTLSIAPGAELRFNKSVGLTVGSSSVTYGPGALIAKGTEEKKILFTSNQKNPAPFDWYGITFLNTSDDTTSVLDHCIIEYAGSNGAVYIYQASPTITNSTIRYSSDYGIYSRGGSPNISGNSVTNNGNYAIYVNTGSAAIIGNTFSQNSSYDIYYNGTADGNISNNSTVNGIFVSSATSLENYSNNTITYNNDFPMRVHPDDVGELMASSSFTGIDSDSYIEVIAGTITKDATWPDTIRYHIAGSITVLGTDGEDAITTLSIAPGAIIKWGLSSLLTIGGTSGSPGALRAMGTSEKKILFTSSAVAPKRGNWHGILFNTTAASTSVLDNCIVEYAGYGNYGAISAQNSSPSIKNNIVKNNSSYGIKIQNGSPVIDGNTVSDNNNFAIKIDSGQPVISNNIFSLMSDHPISVPVDSVGELLSDNTFTNSNSDSYIDVVGGTISRDVTWNGTLPLNILSSITVKGTDGEDNITTLTLNPGQELRFGANLQLIIGGTSGAPGALIAVGTTEKNITFTSSAEKPAPSDWYGVYFYATADASSTIENSIVEYAGYGSYGAIQTNSSSPSIKNNIVKNNGSFGIQIQNGSPVIDGNSVSNNNNYAINVKSGSPVITNNTFSINDEHPLTIAIDSVGELLSDNIFTNTSSESHISVQGGTITKDTTWNGTLPLNILGSITIKGTDGDDAITTLTLSPGLELRFGPYQQFIIGGNSGDPGALNAVGTPEKKIIFTSSTQSPVPGDWCGLTFYSTATESIIKYSTIEYAGYGNYGAIYSYNSAPHIEDVIIQNNQSYGIKVYMGAPQITDSLFSGNGADAIYSQSGNPTITGNSFLYNSGCGVKNVTPTTMISAENNWWRHSSGPLDVSNDTATGGYYNLAGQGACVSDYVDYTPWSTESLVDTDGDSIPDFMETTLYGTDPSKLDSDGDGIGDGEEVANWGGNWNGDLDNDGVINLLDPDAHWEIIIQENTPSEEPIPTTIVYEDAEDGLISGWTIYDEDPVGSFIDNVFDQDQNSRVIELHGDGLLNGFALFDGQGQDWENSSHQIIQWSMKYATDFAISIAANTSRGLRYLSFTQAEIDELGTGTDIFHGLGTSSKDGNWHTYLFDLGYHLEAAQPGNKLISLLGFYASGNGRVDDIMTHLSIPDTWDTDNDNVTDNDEIYVYGTHPYYADTDEDGYDDGVEILQMTDPVDAASHP